MSLKSSLPRETCVQNITQEPRNLIDEFPTFLSCLPFSFCPLPQAGSAERRAVRSALCRGACQSWAMQPMACSWTHRSLHQALIQTSLAGGMPWGSALLCFASHSYLYQQSMLRVPQNEREGERKREGG